MKITIAITMKNCLAYTQDCIKTLNAGNTEVPFYLLLVDNGSLDGTVEWITGLKEAFDAGIIQGANPLIQGIDVMLKPEAPSLAGLWNLAMERTTSLGYDACLICNNDILFSKHTIRELVARFQRAIDNNERIGMVTAHNMRSKFKDNPRQILSVELPEEATESEGPDFSCFLCSIHAWNTIGKFDENYVPCYFEDNDTHTMFKIYDLKAININSAPYYHFGSVTQNSVPGGTCQGAQFRTNHAYFIKKFGVDPAVVNDNLEQIKLKLMAQDMNSDV